MIIGTAGHVNHGKTTLVKTLTGVDCDVLAEEKRRGITIQLGFTRWELPGGRTLSVVDVPGHASLAHTMATGALGLDAVLLTVAADEGVMPQTREHLHTCKVLGVERAVVALTRIDRVADVELTREQVRQALQGSVAQDAPIVPVCAPQGRGLTELGQAVSALLDAPALRNPEGPLLLPIDRVFSLRGFGTVVTGSLLRGCLQVGDSLCLLPSSKPARVRTLHVHGEQVERVGPGQRVGVNVATLKAGEVTRGSFLSRSDEMCVGSVFDAELCWLPHLAKPLTSARSVGYVCGAVRARARVRADASIEPGAVGTGRVVLDRPVALSGGLHFVLRGQGDAEHGAVVGGGCIIDAAPPRRRKAAIRAALSREDALVDVLLEEAGALGVNAATLRARLGLGAPAPSQRLFSPDAMRRAREDILQTLAAFHRNSPTEPGLADSELPAGAASGVALAALLEEGLVSREDALLRLPAHDSAAGKGARSALAQELLAQIEEAALQGPTEQELLAASSQPAAKVREALRELEKDKRLMRCEGMCFAASAVERLMAELLHAVVAEGQLPVSWLKDKEKLSRKHAIPLWTLMDRLGVTVRRGNLRVPGPRARAHSS